jgi:hypothetical protein
MRQLGESSIFPKVAFGCLALSLLLHFIAMGAPQWARADQNKMERKEHIGLWRFCTYPYGGGEACSDFVDIIVGGKFITNHTNRFFIFSIIPQTG